MSAPLSIYNGDTVITCDLREPFDWDESLPADSDLYALEEPDDAVAGQDQDGSGNAADDPAAAPGPIHLVMQLDKDTQLEFSIESKAPDCYSATRFVFALSGSAGLDDFSERNNLTRIGRAEADLGSEGIEANDGSPPSIGEKLLFRSRELVEEQAYEATRKIEKPALNVALKRLEDARNEVLAEAGRYLFRTPGHQDSIVNLFEIDAPGSSSQFIGSRPDARQMVKAWLALRPLVKALAAAQAREGKGTTTKLGQLLQRERGRDLSGVLSPAQMRDIQTTVANDPTLVGLRGETLNRRQALAEKLEPKAAEFPVLWRVYVDEPTPEALGHLVYGALQRTYQANRSLNQHLQSDQSRVWQYPLLIHDAMDRAEVPECSIARTAIDEKLRENGSLGVIGWLSTMSGLAGMGVAAGAALGLVVASPGLVVALTLADIFINLADAEQTRENYQSQSEAFLATLNPSQSLSAEPDAFEAALAIGFDLVSVVPH